MFCLRSSSNGDEAQKAAQIDEELRKDATRKNKQIKLLLLGAGESGKSTLAKQIKIIHESGFSREELTAYTLPIYANCLSALKVVIGLTVQREEMPSKRARKAAEEIKTIHGVSKNTWLEVKDVVSHLMADAAVKKTMEEFGKYRAPDSSYYFLTNLDRIFTEDYLPTVDDVLRARVKTSGVFETQFRLQSDDTEWILVDVGGQRTERRKWIHCFDDVTAVLFCVSLNEYDLGLEEDSRVNRMQESLQLFNETCSSSFFREASVILFLNKDDLFREKIKRVDLKICFDDYRDGKEYEPALKHIKSKFTSKERKIYTHVSVAINTEKIKFIFQSVLDTILAAEQRREWV